MYRIDNATAITPIPAPAAVGPNPNSFFTKGNPGTGVQATIVDDDWANAVQEEIAGVIEGAGIVLSKTVRSQLLSAIQAIGGQGRGALADTGAANAYVLTPATPISAYANGQKFSFVPANNNTGASTLNVSGKGAKTILTPDGLALRADAISASGVAEVIYSATLDKMILTTMATSQASGRVRIPGTKYFLTWASYSLTPNQTTNIPSGMAWGQATLNFGWSPPDGALYMFGDAAVTTTNGQMRGFSASMASGSGTIYVNGWASATFPFTGTVWALVS